jgi:hypothetical protein
MVWHRVWVAALQEYVDPPEQIPSAPADPQPTQNCPTVSMFPVQVSGQAPSVVWQPPAPASQAGSQHWFPGPVPQVACVAVQVQPVQVSLVPLQYRVQVAG